MLGPAWGLPSRPDLLSCPSIAFGLVAAISLCVASKTISAACRALCPGCAADAPVAEILAASAVRDTVSAALRRHNEKAAGSSERIARATLLAEPLSIDANEITDKGYINQRAVLERRAVLVERLFAEPVPAEVIVM